MCGIFAAISRDVACPEPSPEHLAALQNRGPDLCQTQDVCTEISDYRTVNLKLLSTVLALRGDHLARQPLVDESTNSILCWNGEGWKFFGRPVDGNDGELLCQQLSEVIEPNDASGTIGSTLHHLQHISGPYSFVYYDSFHQLVYFARDCIGRRSLLYNVDDVPGTVLLSSIAGSASGSWKEVEADGIYVLALDQTKSKDLFVDLHPCPSEIQSSAFAIAKFLHMPSDKKGICKVRAHSHCVCSLSDCC